MISVDRPLLISRGHLLALAAVVVFACGPAPTEDEGSDDPASTSSILESGALGAPASRRLSPDSDSTSPPDKLGSPEMSLEQAQAVADDPAAPASCRARANRRVGRSLTRQGRLREAEARLETAIELFAAEPTELAPALTALSDVYFRLGAYERQEEVLWQALEHAVAASDQRSEAASWNNLGVSYAARGKPSAALAAYHRCLELRQDLDDRRGVASSRHNLGVQLLMLGRIDEGVEELRQAVAARRLVEDPAAVGRSLASLAWGLTLDDQRSAALDAYAEAVSLLEQADADHDLAVALEQRAQLYRGLRRNTSAREDLQRSLDLLDSSGGARPVDAAYLRLGLGAVEREQAEPDQVAEAVAVLRAAVETFDALDAQEGRILARLELARALRLQESGHDEAIRQLEAAIEIVEAARSDLRLPSFRATFLGGWQAVYQELIDLLASASLAAPAADAPALAARALEVAETARARALLDRMAAADLAAEQPSRRVGASPPAGSEPWQGLKDEVEELEARALLEPAEGNDPGTRGSGRSAIDSRVALREARFALERAREVSRRAEAPSPAATPAGAFAIRRQLDADTVLLVYSLAPGRSWLWRLDLHSVAVIPLPPGPEIETAARNAHQLLPMHHKLGYGKAAREALARLSRLVLGPLALGLGTGRTRPGRLAVVPDGALHLVPFGALPLPGGGAGSSPGTAVVPLAAAYEVVHLPSASTLVELRGRAARAPAPRLLAVVADPVFEAGDPRLGTGPGVPEPPAVVRDQPFLARTRRALAGRLGRLPASAEEGSRVAEIAHRSSGVAPEVHRGFDASRELVTGGGLGDFRILHFATHGLADAEDPALAGLVLSLYDTAGRPRDGLLRARDLHRLRLSADLVVLSACRTALGQEIRGEGLVGLADGFFAAGTSHLVVSLWDVDDRATAELMARFYRHLLLGDRGPAGALRHAQQELRGQTEWRSPAHWAAFVAVGDWQIGGFVPERAAGGKLP